MSETKTYYISTVNGHIHELVAHSRIKDMWLEDSASDWLTWGGKNIATQHIVSISEHHPLLKSGGAA